MIYIGFLVVLIVVFLASFYFGFTIATKMIVAALLADGFDRAEILEAINKLHGVTVRWLS